MFLWKVNQYKMKFITRYAMSAIIENLVVNTCIFRVNDIVLISTFGHFSGPNPGFKIEHINEINCEGKVIIKTHQFLR